MTPKNEIADAVLKILQLHLVIETARNGNNRLNDLLETTKRVSGNSDKAIMEAARIADKTVIEIEQACKRYLDETRKAGAASYDL